MYSEAADFEHHKAEVDRYFSTIEPLGVSTSAMGRCLDFGAGLGMHAGCLSPHFAEIWAADIIDYSSLYGGEFIKLIREKHERNGVPFVTSGIRFVNTDGMDLLFRDNFFDSVVSFNVFEHVPDPARALAEILRVLKPGGHAYISFDPIWTCDTGSHFSDMVPEPWAHVVLTGDEFCARMLSAGGTTEQCQEFRVAMNRWRLQQHAAVFDNAVSSKAASLLCHHRWSGVANPGNLAHSNFAQARELGFSEEELLVRSLCYVVAKPATAL